MNEDGIENKLDKEKKRWEARYPGLEFVWEKNENDNYYVKYRVENFFGKFEKGFIHHDEDIPLSKELEVLEKSLTREAMHWFLSPKSPSELSY